MKGKKTPKRVRNEMKKKKNATTPTKNILRTFEHPDGASPITGNHIVRDHFKTASTKTSSTTAATFSLFQDEIQVSFLGLRGVAMGDLFLYYRVVGLRITVVPHGMVITGGNLVTQGCDWVICCAFTPKDAFTAPTTNFTNMIDFPHFRLFLDYPVKPFEFYIGREELLSSMPYEWLKTTSTGVTEDENYKQLTIMTASLPLFNSTSSGTPSSIHLIYDFEVEFRGDVSPALIPFKRLHRPQSKPPQKKDDEKKIRFSEDFCVMDPVTGDSIISRDIHLIKDDSKH